MKRNNKITMKVDFEDIPIIDKEFYGLKEANKAWREVRRKLE